MVEKYDTMVVLVHPLYLVFDMMIIPHCIDKFNKISIDDYKKLNINDFAKSIVENILNPKKNVKPELNKVNKIIKKEFGEYGKLIQKYKNDPKVCVCIVNQHIRTFDDFKQEAGEKYAQHFRYNTYKQVHDILLERFNSHGKELLKDRFVTTTFSPGHDSNFLSQEYYSRLNKEVKIIGFGEYYNDCVKKWCEKYIPTKLYQNNIKVKEIQLLEKHSIRSYNNFIREGTGLGDMLLFGHERRKTQISKKLKTTKNQHLSAFLKNKIK
ncbi:MAG: hypothetical protein WCF78_03035 [archaeon]